MSVLRAPYKTGMVLGMGFNSYTQSTCLNSAVTIAKKETPVAKGEVPQKVEYRRVFVDKLSQVAQNLNISGAVDIKYGTISGSGSGSYVDASTFSQSDINFFLSVQVNNQPSVTDQRTETFNKLRNVTKGNFASIYGDTYIAELEEGGVFQAVVSIKILDKSSKEVIRAQASIAFSSLGGNTIGAKGEVEKAKETLDKSTEITIFAKWEGGGQVKKPEDPWTIDELIRVGGSFPDLCAKAPQTSFVVLRKYIHLASFQDQVDHISPLSYENAAAYTNMLLDNFVDYQQLQVTVDANIEGLRKKTIQFDPTADPPEGPNPFKPTLLGMIAAKADLLVQMGAITKLVDQIAIAPDIIGTFNASNPAPYVDSAEWETRLPAMRPTPVVVPPPAKTGGDAPAPTPALDNNIVLRGRPAVAASHTSHDIFAQGTDGFLWLKSSPAQTAPDSANVGIWSYQGDGVLLSSDCSPVAVVSGGTKYVFAVGADSKLYFKSAATDGGTWSALRMPSGAAGVKLRGGIAACAGPDGRVDVVVIGVDDVAHWAAIQGDGTWTPLTALPGVALQGTPAIARNGGNGSLSLVSVDVDFALQANTLPANGSNNSAGWRGWSSHIASYCLGGEVHICWPVQTDPGWKTQMDVAVLGEMRNRVYEFQLLNDQWRAEFGNLGKDWLRSSPAAAVRGFGKKMWFAIGSSGDQRRDPGGVLWMTTWERGKVDAASNWMKAAVGPFRAVQPVVVSDVNSDHHAVYVVTVAGKLVRYRFPEFGIFGPERM